MCAVNNADGIFFLAFCASAVEAVRLKRAIGIQREYGHNCEHLHPREYVGIRCRLRCAPHNTNSECGEYAYVSGAKFFLFNWALLNIPSFSLFVQLQ